MPKTQTDNSPIDAAAPKPLANYRAKRRIYVIAMVLCALAVNATERFYIDHHPLLTVFTRSVMMGMMLVSVFVIGFYVAACRAYARMRGHSSWLGVGGAAVGIAVWLGITVYLQWPTIVALANGDPTPDWDTHPPVALWAGLAAGALLLKSIPERGGDTPLAVPVTAPQHKKA